MKERCKNTLCNWFSQYQRVHNGLNQALFHKRWLRQNGDPDRLSDSVRYLTALLSTPPPRSTAIWSSLPLHFGCPKPEVLFPSGPRS